MSLKEVAFINDGIVAVDGSVSIYATAKEMFEGLGLFNVTDMINKARIEDGDKPTDDIVYRKSYYEMRTQCWFNKEEKCIEVGDNYTKIDIPTLKAINKQIEELGW